MTHNDISPGFVKIFYAMGVRQHVMTLPVQPIDPQPGSNVNELRAGLASAPVLFTDAVDEFVQLLLPMYYTSGNFGRAELWSKPTPEADPQFIQSHIIGLAGTSEANPLVYGQMVLSHRTRGGGIHRLYLMEASWASDLADLPPFASPLLNALSTYMTQTGEWIFGRDGTDLISPLRFTTKINDALRKKYLDL